MKKTAIILSVLLITFILPSCGEQNNISCREVLAEIISAEIGLPAGKTYSIHAPEGDEEYLPDSLVDVLYGGGKRPVMADGWLDLAIFLPSSAHACEFAVFLCDSENCATDTARMLCSRLDLIRTTKGEGEYASYLDNATVTVIRNYVLFLISSDCKNAMKIASETIG